MRNQPLIGYVLHQAAYGESRSLVYLFSEQVGMIHGIGKKNLPLFMPINVMANGKKSLKTFGQSQIGTVATPLTGQGLFAGMYLNEILVKLLPIEEPMPSLWLTYQHTLQQLAQLFSPPADTGSYSTHHVVPDQAEPDSLMLLKVLLRQFEHRLFEELGYGIDLTQDSLGEPLLATQAYRYRLQQGFVPIAHEDIDRHSVTGEMLRQWQTWLESSEQFMDDYHSDATQAKHRLNQISHSYRLVIDDLLNYQALQSRELWRQLNQFS